VLLAIAWLGCAMTVVPEALAAAYVAEHHLPTAAVGVLLAASPAGTAVGGVVVTRLVPPARRQALLLPLLLLCAAPLPLVAASPALPVTIALLALSGAGAACLLLASTTVAREVPAAVRGRVYGIASSGLMVAQGVAVVASGALADVLDVDLVLVVTGCAGLLLTALVARAWARATRSAAAVLEVDGGVGAQLGEGVL
jgi:predicted MFS family arabinose efflux permease